MSEASREPINLDELDDLQTELLHRLDDLNQRIERTLAEVTTTRAPCDAPPTSM